MAYKKPNADERFRKLIDDFNVADQFYKHFEREREYLVKKLRNIVRRRGRGVHNGNESSITAQDVVRKILSQEKVRDRMLPSTFNKCFAESKYISITGGPMVPPEQEVPDLGPPTVVGK
jgi:hypothetical protein